LLVGAAALPITGTAIAAADSQWPVAGAESASATLQDLAAQGYDIQINWVSGYPDVPLSECWVDDIHNPDGRPHPGTLSTVYVDIGCPSSDLD